MKNFSIFIVFSAVFLFSCKQEQKEKSPASGSAEMAYHVYGEDFNNQNTLTSAETEKEFKNIKPGDTLHIAFSSTVNEVCKEKGCWMQLDLPQEDDVMVKFKDYGFFVPKDIEEKEVVVNGKAYVAEVSVEEQKHYAEDKGQTAEEVAAITQPKRTLSFLANGVLIKE